MCQHSWEVLAGWKMDIFSITHAAAAAAAAGAVNGSDNKTAL